MKQNEIGRTMVEMLGVLAIVGILSVTGIKGFMMAMDKLSANSIAEVIGAASMYAQTNNLDIKNWNDLAEDYEGAQPACVEAIEADKKSGKVTITFKETDKCLNIMNLVGNSFGRCRWEVDAANSKKATFEPSRRYDRDKGSCI